MDKFENVWIQVYDRVYDNWDHFRFPDMWWNQRGSRMADILRLSLDLKQEVLSLKKHE